MRLVLGESAPQPLSVYIYRALLARTSIIDSLGCKLDEVSCLGGYHVCRMM